MLPHHVAMHVRASCMFKIFEIVAAVVVFANLFLQISFAAFVVAFAGTRFAKRGLRISLSEHAWHMPRCRVRACKLGLRPPLGIKRDLADLQRDLKGNLLKMSLWGARMLQR